MVPPELYVFKSAYRHEYRRQNLDILQLPEGEIVTSRYRFQWIPEALRSTAALRQRSVVIVLADGPNWYYIPARRATINRVSEREGFFQLDLELLDFINASDGEFEAMLRAQYADFTPPKTFITERRDDFPLLQCAASEEVDRWRTLIDAVSRHEPYKNSVFLRFDTPAIVDERGRPVSSNKLERQRQYLAQVMAYNPHLESQLASLTWDLSDTGNMLNFPTQQKTTPIPPDGRVSLAFRPLDEGGSKLHISVLPNKNDESTHLNLETVVYDSPDNEDSPDPVPPQEADRIRHLYQFVLAHYATHPSAALQFLDDCIVSLLPLETWPLEERGRLLAQEKRWTDAVEVFEKVGVDRLAYEYKYHLLFSALRCGREDHWNLHLKFDGRKGEDLRACLREIGDEGLLRYAEKLLVNLGGEETAEILASVHDCVHHPRSILGLAIFWANKLGDSVGAERLLNEAIQARRLPETEDTLRTVLQLRKKIGISRSLVSAYDELMDHLLMNSRLEDARELYEDFVSTLNKGEGRSWYRELEYCATRLAEALLLRSQEELIEHPLAVQILVDLSESALRANEVHLAWHYVEQAHALARQSMAAADQMGRLELLREILHGRLAEMASQA